MRHALLAALFCALPGLCAAQEALPAPVIDNSRVTVRDIHLEKAVPGPTIPHAGDYVVLYFDGGRIRDASGKVHAWPEGAAAAGHGGTSRDTALDGPSREIVVELKDAPSHTVPNTTGLPPAFPRAGARLVLETPRVRVWNYNWTPGKPSVMHFHDTEVVVAYRGDGEIAATTPDGKTTSHPRKTGDIVFNQAGRSHSEALVAGHAGGVMLELK